MKRLERILLIDDERFDHMASQRLLRTIDGIGAVHEFDHARDALAFLAEAPPGPGDVIFLDVNMPAMNGFEFLDAATEAFGPALGGAIVIMLSTSLNPADRERSLGYEAIKGFENKPLTALIVERARVILESAA
ncbi:MAG: response regulator [Silicimonas sp.]|nr:response regulator [Silicimonas sp.]